MIDPETGCDDEADAALKLCIDEIIEEIHRVKELDRMSVESIYNSMFGKDIDERYQEYLDDTRTG